MICSHCSSEIPPGFKFCGFCGHKLEDCPVSDDLLLRQTVESSDPPQPKTPAHQRPPPRDERREVVILFADVSGFTSMSEKLDPEEVHSVMNEVFEGLGKTVQEEDGYIDKYMGDNIMALFGAPVAHEDDASRACRAALAMQRFLSSFAEKSRSKTGVSLRMRVGIHCGMVLAGGIGSNFRKDYSVMGDTVNLAARLESNAPPGGILVSKEVARRTRRRFEFGPAQLIKVKGKEKPVEALLLLRETAETSPALKDELPSPFVGRDSELGRVADLLRTSRAKNRWIEIVGETGLGKTRLVWEAAKQVENLKLLPVAGVAQFRHHPFGLIKSLVRALTHEIAGDRSPPQNRHEFGAALEPLGGDLHAYLDVLWYLSAPRTLAVPVPDPDPQTLRRILEKGTTLLLERFSRHKPEVRVFLDSYHLADDASRSLIERQGGSPQGWPLTIVAASQEKRPASLRDQVVIEINPLSRDSAAALLDNLTKGANLPGELRQDILRLAAGAPLHIVEMVKSLIDEGILAFDNEKGEWTCNAKAVAVALPSTIFSAMVSRLDRLEAPKRDLLCQFSIQGVEFDVSIAEAIRLDPKWSGPPAADLLPELESLGLISRVRSFDASPARWVFRQPLLREASYQTLLLRDRRELHANVAENIRKKAGESVGNFSEQLAHHYEISEQWALAAEANMLAGNRAGEMFLNDHALSRHKRAVELIDKAESIRTQDDPVRLKALAGAARILLRVGSYSEAEEFAKKLQSAASLPADQADADRFYAAVCLKTGATEKTERFLLQALERIRRDAEAVSIKSWVLYDLAGLYYRAGKMDTAKDFLRQHRAVQTPAYDADMIHADVLEGKIAHAQGRFSEAAALFSKAYATARKLGSMSDLANACNNLGNASRDKGDYKAAQERFEEALIICERTGATESIAGIHINLGNLAISRGDLETAREHHQKSLKAFLEIGNMNGVALAQINLAIAAMENGDGPEATAEAEAAIRTLGNSDSALLMGLSLVVLGEGLLACGETGKAESVFADIIKNYKKEDHPLAIAGALRGLGRAALSRGAFADAARYLDQAIGSFERLRREQEATRTALYRAEALWRLGNRERAQSELQRAQKRFEAMEARLDAQRADRLLRKLSGSA